MMECAVSLCITEGQVPSSATEKGEKQVNERERFEKFTERARKVLSLAQEEAQRLQHQYIGTEHVPVSYTHLPSPRDRQKSRMPSSA